MMLSPLGIPFMQRALGQGQLSEQDLRQIMQEQGGQSSVGGMMRGGVGGMGPATPQIGNIGMGPSAPQQPPMPFFQDQQQWGPQQQGGGGGGSPMASFDPSSGNWTPGPGGFPQQDRAETALRMMITGGK